jgi:hypothetical protein
MLPIIGKHCFFCQKLLKEIEPISGFDKYIHYYCPIRCCKVMTLRSGDWVLFRAYFDVGSSIEINKRLGEKFLYQDRNTSSGDIYLPLFDINSYTLHQLKNKIKKYLLFL